VLLCYDVDCDQVCEGVVRCLGQQVDHVQVCHKSHRLRCGCRCAFVTHVTRAQETVEGLVSVECMCCDAMMSTVIKSERMS
jgi:hypothetical protein